MRLCIDASNIRAGGGITHLSEMLRAAQPDKYGMREIVVWSGKYTLARLPKRPWLRLLHEPLLDGPLVKRLYWQAVKLSQLAENYDLLFVPGGTYLGTFTPFVAVSQNLFPFEPQERRRFGLSWSRLRLTLLEKLQAVTFQRAAGAIFLTETARQVVEQRIGHLPDKIAIVPHGVSDHFRLEPRVQRPLSVYSLNRPFRWLYVSIVDLYKHQWHVAEAVAKLRLKGIPIALDLVGPSRSRGLRRLRKVMRHIDPAGRYICYHGLVPYSELASFYHQADGFVFASSCENMPNILLEAMAAGLPIACSNRGPMPEILGGAGVYFDPEDPSEIAGALYTLMMAPDKRERYAWAAYEQAQQYSWERCARETLAFLAEVAENSFKCVP